jgi:ribosomal protein S20
LARTPRKWTGARSPSGLKRVRSSERRHEILGPRRAAAKTLVRNAIDVATTPGDQDPQVALAEAMSALDRAAKVGAIHKNQAARRKSRLAIKVYDLLAGTTVVAKGKAAKSVGKAQAQKAARARIAAGKAGKAKGAQTAAGKARAALSKTTRAEAAAEAAPVTTAPSRPAASAKAAAKPATKPATKPAAKKAKTAAKAKATATKSPATTKKAAKS